MKSPKKYLEEILPNQTEFGINQVISLLENYANQSKWISVEDEPPPIDRNFRGISEDILLLSDSGSMYVGFYNRYTCKFQCEVLEVSQVDNITHWQPLPEKP